MKNVINLVLVTALLILCAVFIYKVEECNANTENETVYVVCDVAENGADWIDAEMPNGEIHTYNADDLPETDVEIVVFATENQDDYETYKVVAIR